MKLLYGTGEENTFNSTLFLQNTTDTAYICTDTLENIYYFYLYKRKQFPTGNDLALGFLQNLLANVLRLTAINNKLTELREEKEETGKDTSAQELYYIGVIMRMLIIFDPITDDLQRLVTTNSFKSQQQLQLDFPVDIPDVPEVPVVPGDEV